MSRMGHLECENRAGSIVGNMIGPTNLARVGFDTILESGFQVTQSHQTRSVKEICTPLIYYNLYISLIDVQHNAI